MSDGADDPIARFYDSHPYPPPITDLTSSATAWSNGKRQRIEHHRRWPTIPFRDDHSILVAGCGTSQAATYAVRYPRAHVVGIDVSAASLRATSELAERNRLTNLELRELAIEGVGDLDRSFDHIVCTGVLHHVADPAAGLAALRSVLAPSGVVDLMVYAAFGRTGVAMIQQYCRMLGVRPESAEIDDLVATLRELPIGHPLSHLLRNAPDFGAPDALADALLNPREHAYTVPAIFELLSSTGLRFDRWVRQAPYRPQCGVLSDLPHGRRIESLPLAEQFSALELFRGTMVRHGLIAHRDDEPPTEFDFDGEQAGSFVPIRTASSVAVEDKLPDGVAAALLNRAHSFPDLVLLATAEERRMFDLIDGERTIGDIGDDARFFERLWWHDLVVFDASAAPPRAH